MPLYKQDPPDHVTKQRHLPCLLWYSFSFLSRFYFSPCISHRPGYTYVFNLLTGPRRLALCPFHLLLHPNYQNSAWYTASVQLIFLE